MRTNADITVYNRRVSGQDETFYITHIRNVSWQQHYFTIIPNAGLVASVSSLGYVGSNVFSVRIPVVQATMDKTYVTPAAYKTSDPATTFTLMEGDWVVKGITNDALQTAILHNLEAMQVRSVHDNRDTRLSAPMRHWRLVG
jgi:hypothetical protein